ncbi:MAG: alpha/beta hydrolase [Gammaproteobacteria bacterium]
MQINGKEIFVSESGEGEPLIMIHGLGGNVSVWGSLMGVLSRLFRVVSIDLEGAGFSPNQSDRFTMDSCMEDILAVMDSINADSAHLMGHSVGTVICQLVAEKNPKRVKSLVLLGSLHDIPEGARSALKDRAAKVRQEGMVEVANTVSQASTSAETKALRPEIVAFTREMLYRQDPEGYARYCEAASEAPVPDLGKIKCPVLLITGNEDIVGPPLTSRRIKEKLVDARLLIVNGVGHQTSIEKPEPVASGIINFYVDKVL